MASSHPESSLYHFLGLFWTHWHHPSYCAGLSSGVDPKRSRNQNVDERNMLGHHLLTSSHCSHPAASWENSLNHCWVPTNAFAILSNQRVLHYFPYCFCHTFHHPTRSTTDYHLLVSCHYWTEKSHTHDQIPRKTGVIHPAYHDLQKIFKPKKKYKKINTSKGYIRASRKENNI